MIRRLQSTLGDLFVSGQVVYFKERRSYISRYVSNASFAAISSFRNFADGNVASSNGGSYSFDHGDLHGSA